MLSLRAMDSETMADSWQVRTLRERDRDQALGFLYRNELINVYLISRLQEDGVGTDTVEIRRGGQTVCVAALHLNVSIGLPPEIEPEGLDSTMKVLADVILSRAVPIRAIISPAEAVDSLWKRISRRYEPPTVVRLSQPVYLLDADPAPFPRLESVRYAIADDLPHLVPACAAMHLEEVGIDPLARDAVGYQRRIQELVSSQRSFVLMKGPQVVFKCEISARSSRAVQLMGVWTAPGLRRQGWAERGMREVCGHLLRQGLQVTLFVNDFNAPAVALYESLGFRQIGTNRALIW